YSAFGNLLASTGSTENPYRYIGELGYQQETGLSGYYLRRRYYQPGAGSFLSCDPVALAGTSAYAYVGNRPAMGADPSGLKCDPRTCKPRRVQKNRKTHTHTEYTWCPSAKKYKQPIWGKLTVWWDTWDVYDEDWGCVPVLICRGLAVEDFCKLHSSKLVARGYSTGSYMCVGERVGPPVTNPYEPGQKLCESVCKATCEAFGLFAHAVICHYVGADLTCWIVHFTLDPVGAACDTFCTDLCDFV
ncbi:MAG: RHS repeat-associated core domain-containing protein, partial [Armatimonadetes bacterium]|nr:RHS repeat-associated core domain-containing protein [Armatimonadota bacterium]